MTDLRDADEALLARAGRAAEAAALARPQRARTDPLQEMMGLPGPVWENQPESKLADGQCVIFHGSRRCPHPATHWMWIGCTGGEHLDRSGVCEGHAMMCGRDTTTYRCRRCWDAVRAISGAKVIKVEEIDGQA
jgi:hypothetical protein